MAVAVAQPSYTDGTSSASVTFATAPAATSLIVAFMASSAGPQDATNPGWTFGPGVGATGGQGARWFYRWGDGTTKTFTLVNAGGGKDGTAVWWAELTGVLSAAFVDVTATKAPGSGTSAALTGAATAQADEIWLAGVTTDSASTSGVSVDAGYTLRAGSPHPSTLGDGIGSASVATKIVSATGAPSVTFTVPSSNNSAALLTLKAAASGGGGGGGGGTGKSGWGLVS